MTRIEQVRAEQLHARAEGALDIADLCAQEIHAIERGYVTADECLQADYGLGTESDRRVACVTGLNGWWRSGTSYYW